MNTELGMQKEQFIHIDSYGVKCYYSDREMTKRHREDGPAVEDADGLKEWWINGQIHREDENGVQLPAIEWADGTKCYYLNGNLHREDGPAVEYANGHKEWWFNDENLTEAEFNARMDPVTELTLDDIAEKFGVSVEQLKIKK